MLIIDEKEVFNIELLAKLSHENEEQQQTIEELQNDLQQAHNEIKLLNNQIDMLQRNVGYLCEENRKLRNTINAYEQLF